MASCMQLFNSEIFEQSFMGPRQKLWDQDPAVETANTQQQEKQQQKPCIMSFRFYY